jgi:SecD/SecF fusion protein
MTSSFVFVTGLLMAGLFGWYFLTDNDRTKRILGSILSVAIVALAVLAVYPPEQKLPLGLDLKGGTSFLIRLKAESDESGVVRPITPAMLDQAREVIRRRVDSMGTSEPVIAPQGVDRILVQIPGLNTGKLEEAREQLYKPAKLEFKMVHPQSEGILRGSVPPDPAYRMETYKEDRGPGDVALPPQQLVVKKKADIPGTMVSGARAFYDTQGWGVSLRFTSEGAALFAKLTQENVNKRFAIMLDGNVQSAPVIREAITGGNASITGSFTEAQARNLASVLENPLQTPVVIEEERSASASLGEDSINSGIFSGLLGVAMIALFVLVYYRFSGVIANIALLVNLVLLFGAMGFFGTVLTLPGIAGVILTLGMAVDANVLVYERLREEMSEKRPLTAVVRSAFEKAFPAIFDSNVTTLITALILFWKATGPVKGFAVALTIGIVATLFTALVASRNLFSWALETGMLKSVSMGRLLVSTNINFLGWRKAAVTGSVVVILSSVALFWARGDKNFGVDFKGGDRVVLEAVKVKPELKEVRHVVDAQKAGEVAVQIEKSAAKEFFTIRSPQGTGEKLAGALKEKFPQAEFRLEQVETVGSLVGGELARNSVMALALGMLGILVYVTLRFEFSFALGALVALLHDGTITIGVFALLGRELSRVTVGAVLTIAGYSVNDTIVVFDRIREGMNTGRKGSVMDIMNSSINETLSRTIITGGVTLLSTISLFFFGGPVLADFALAILIGVLVGTYSSVFVAAPVVLWWNGNRADAKVVAAGDSRSA